LKVFACGVAAGAFGLAPAGCSTSGGHRPGPVAEGIIFSQRRTGTHRQTDPRPEAQPVDQSGLVVQNDVPIGPGVGGPTVPEPPQGNGAAPGVSYPEGLGEERTRNGSRSAGANGAVSASQPGTPPDAPATGPAVSPRNGGPAPDSFGTYQLVGTVLAEANGQPIFADRVLAAVEPALAAAARQLDERQFRTAAVKLVGDQLMQAINDEVEFAIAQRRLSAADQQTARALAIKWKEDQITQAGGSVAVARQRFSARGQDFDEAIEEQYRRKMREIYYFKKERPLIQVSASDIRQYYQENLKREFTTPDKARFRVIKVDKRKSGGREAALAEVQRLRERVVSGGKDFAELAAEDNDEEAFKRPVEWFERGSFAVPAVEDAVWKLQPGQVTDVVETEDAFYIAKVELIQPGGVLPFNEPEVQRRIHRTLHDRQFGALRTAKRKAFMEDAVYRFLPDEQTAVQTAVDMAVQRYRHWRQGSPAGGARAD